MAAPASTCCDDAFCWRHDPRKERENHEDGSTSSNQRRQPCFDREAYRQRNRIERLINRLKQFRRIATRYEKRGANYLAMVMLGMILLWL